MECDSVQDIIVNFLNGTNIKAFDFKKLPQLTWDEQTLLLNQTLKHPAVKKYPMQNSYCIAFLKNLINQLEILRMEVHDDLYNCLCNLMTFNIQEFTYKHFCILDNNKLLADLITLKESSRLISDGTTGLRSWEAACVLGEWCWKERKSLNNKSILELGSGAGFAGIFISKYCQPRNLILSDCHEKVLDLLIENVKLNFVTDLEYVSSDAQNKLFTASLSQTSNEISVVNLPWQKMSCNGHLGHIDYVLGADIVYDPTLFDTLCSALKYILENNTVCKVILINTVRNKNNYETFLKCLDSHNLFYCYLEVPTPEKLVWNSVVSEFSLISVALSQ